VAAPGSVKGDASSSTPDCRYRCGTCPPYTCFGFDTLVRQERLGAWKLAIDRSHSMAAEWRTRMR